MVVGRSPTTPPRNMNTQIFPGQPWLDTEGKRIQAHGGSILFEDGVYHWYGGQLCPTSNTIQKGESA